MTTMGEKIVSRLDALEAQLTDMQLNNPAGDPGRPVPPDESMRGLNELLSQLRQRVEQIELEGIRAPGDQPRGPTMSAKDLMPDTLSAHYREKW